MRYIPDKPYAQMSVLELLETWCDINDSGLLRWQAKDRQRSCIMDELHKRQRCLVRQDNPKKVGYEWGIVTIMSDIDRDVYQDDVPREVTK